jgi:hypothetical protein
MQLFCTLDPCETMLEEYCFHQLPNMTCHEVLNNESKVVIILTPEVIGIAIRSPAAMN